jgi:anaerobic ribonucleoside-triphosphate reductase
VTEGTNDSAEARRVRAVRTEVYSRIVGYYRPVQDWNKGKQEEFAERQYVDIGKPSPGTGE